MVNYLLSKNKSNADVVLLGLIYDKTSSFGKGADKGPQAVIECLGTQIELYERFTKWSPAKHLKIVSMTLPDIGDLKPENMVGEVSSAVRKILDKNQFLISLGGEHSLTAGIMDAYAKRGFNKNTSILQIDAHFDLRDDDSDYNPNPSRFAHSCAMKRSIDMGFKLTSVGIRAYSDFEMETANKNKVSVFEWPRKEDKKLVSDIIKSIKTQNVYITLDVDGIDPAHMPATGTPVQGGLGWDFTFNLLRAVFERKNVIGADIVEVAPRENESLTEYGAAQICYYMIALKFKGKPKNRKGL